MIVAGFSVLKSIGVTRYICRDCGFTEEWIDSKDDIEKINRLYSEVE